MGRGRGRGRERGRGEGTDSQAATGGEDGGCGRHVEGVVAVTTGADYVHLFAISIAAHLCTAGEGGLTSPPAYVSSLPFVPSTSSPKPSIFRPASRMALAAAAIISAFWSSPVKCSAVNSAPVCTGESSSLKLSAMALVTSSGLTVSRAVESAFRSGKIDIVAGVGGGGVSWLGVILYNPSPGPCHGFMVNHSGRMFVLQRHKLVKLTIC